MCKIAVISGITSETKDKAWEFVKAMAKEMSSYSDKDGLGYAAVDADGNLFGERWWTNADAFETREPLTVLDRALLDEYGGMLGKAVTYNSFGNVENFESVEETDFRSVIIHTRQATTGKEFVNTHPFVIGDTALIHNGIIRNYKELGTKNSTCDSESILVRYLEEGVQDNMGKIAQVADTLEGYYACGIISKTNEGRVIVDVFKDNSAQLCALFIKELNTMVFCTAENMVRAVCRSLQFTIMSEFMVRPGCLMRYDAMTGRVIGTKRFNTTGPERWKKPTAGISVFDYEKRTWTGAKAEASSCNTNLPTEVKGISAPCIVTPPREDENPSEERGTLLDDSYWSHIMGNRIAEAQGTIVDSSPDNTLEGVVYEDYTLDKKDQKWKQNNKKHNGNGKHHHHNNRRNR